VPEKEILIGKMELILINKEKKEYFYGMQDTTNCGLNSVLTRDITTGELKHDQGSKETHHGIAGLKRRTLQ
jgi:hypothetical protein